MIHATGDFCIGALFVGLWLAASVLPFSRVGAMLEDRDHPFAAPLHMMKAILLVVLGAWAICYALIGELGLLFPANVWRFTPEFCFYALGRHTLRQVAILLYCIIISTPGAVLSSKGRRRCETRECDGADIELDELHSGREAVVPILNCIHGAVEMGRSAGSDSFREPHISFNGSRSHLPSRTNRDDNSRLHSAAAPAEWNNTHTYSPCENGVGPGYLHEGGVVMPSDIHIQLKPSLSVSDTDSFMDGPFSSSSVHFRDSGANPASQFPRGSRVNMNSSSFPPSRVHNNEECGIRSGAASVREAESYTVPLNQQTLVSVHISGGASSATRKPPNSFKRKLCFVRNWLTGGPLPTFGTDDEVTRATDKCGPLVHRWKRLVLWDAVLKLRLVLLMWIITFTLVVYLAVAASFEDVQACHEPISETAICWVNRSATPAQRLHPPRSFTTIFLFSDVILLLVWMICGVRCLQNIGNITAKQKFRRAYLMGASLIMLSITYSCFSIFDPLRYNGIVTVVLLIFRNVCDLLLILLLVVQVENSSGPKPSWLIWLRGTVVYGK
ncbi:uncharacterized protein TEOVI_000622200 [Trypanosoma equiperdum]|uniref:Transmembrane protein n=1 Tax=Trypanosoma equiperdum TaxID=5694 RepID=A0A1G4I184_TRYEQ|nr:hypothetical protein, conserved [Trypanosoma equiperdum]